MKRKTSRAIEAKRLRRAFNEKYRDLHVGMLVNTPEAETLIYQGISTFHDPDQITVLLYRANGEYNFRSPILPSEFEYLGRSVPVVPLISERPEVLERSHADSSRIEISFKPYESKVILPEDNTSKFDWC